MAGYRALVRTAKSKGGLLVTPRLEEWLFHHSHLLLDNERAEILKALTTAVPRNRSASFSSSSRGSCFRQQVFSYLGVPQRGEIDPALHAIFIDGTWRHIRWQMLLLMAGILTDIEVPFHRPEIRLRGSLDGANTPEKWGFELKGTSDSEIVFGYKGAIEQHILQVHTYFLGRPELERFVLLYEDKKYQTWKETVITPDPKAMRAVRDEMEYLNWSVDERKLPPVLEECKNGKGLVFTKCPYRDICRGCDYDEAEAAAGTPVSIAGIGSSGGKRPRIKGGAPGTAGRQQQAAAQEQAVALRKRKRLH